MKNTEESFNIEQIIASSLIFPYTVILTEKKTDKTRLTINGVEIATKTLFPNLAVGPTRRWFSNP